VRPFVVLSLPVGTDRQRYWIVVSQNEAFPGAIVDDVARRFLWRYSVILVGVLALLPLVNALSIARLTRVVRRTSHQASAIGPETPGIRLNEANLPVEIRDLVSATNRLIDRLETSLARQRQFVSNLAHELKTPLATLKIELETVADGEQPHQVTQSIKRVDHVISQMRDLAELETLDRARLAPIDLVQLTQRLIGEMTPFIYQQRHEVELVSAAASVVVNGNETLLELALRNLIANAVQHTPDKTRITVEVAASSRLTVADDGPGITTEHQKMMTSRFWRADQSRSDNAGLGLSIVERICEVHGASLEVGTSPQGGASFSIDFGRTV
jgi:signal transduction histidine kinase